MRDTNLEVWLSTQQQLPVSSLSHKSHINANSIGSS